MEACGLITEYNPFHQGHLYHLKKAKKETASDCMVAVMSGNFLQRGEPAIIDKYSRATAALHAGVDVVVELPFAYAVQNSDFFAKGALTLLSELDVSALCFGSETGDIDSFLTAYHLYNSRQASFQEELHTSLQSGLSFPEANRSAYKKAGITETLDLTKPNNILGFSYIKEIEERNKKIKPYTIKRITNNYHDINLTGQISSATSIRKKILAENAISQDTKHSLTEASLTSLHTYKKKNAVWHEWEAYFPFLQYKVATMTTDELYLIHGMEEGLEYRFKKTAREAISFHNWMERLKTKRYTWTRLQRIFTHLLVNCKKSDISMLVNNGIPYVRMLGMTTTGRNYLNQIKKKMSVPLISQIQQSNSLLMDMEERASEAYYSILSPSARFTAISQEYLAPIIIK